MESRHGKAVAAELELDIDLFKKASKAGKSGKGKLAKLSDAERDAAVYEKIIKIKEKEMNGAVKELDFETAAILRDEILVLRERMKPEEEKAVTTPKRQALQ